MSWKHDKMIEKPQEAWEMEIYLDTFKITRMLRIWLQERVQLQFLKKRKHTTTKISEMHFASLTERKTHNQMCSGLIYLQIFFFI